MSARFINSCLPLLGAIFLLNAPLQAFGDEDLTVRWKGGSHPVDSLDDQLPGDLGSKIQEKLASHLEWISAFDYSLAVSEDGRVILVTPSERLQKKYIPQVEKTLKAFDELMAPPERELAQATEAAAEDDIFDGAFGEIDFSASDFIPESEPILLIEVDDVECYQQLVQRFGGGDERLQVWTSSTLREPGFAEDQFMTAAWQSAPEGFEVGDVWRAENEMVNRLGRLLVYRTYGSQPTWLRVAAAWNLEMGIMGDIYCFPFRQEFVGVEEHSGWKNPLKSEFKSRKKKPLKADEFASWVRNTWDEDKAQVSWGVVEYLAQYKEGALPAIAEDYRLKYLEGYLTIHEDETYTTNPAYVVPMDVQLDILKAHAGEYILEELHEFFAKWKKPKTKKSKRR